MFSCIYTYGYIVAGICLHIHMLKLLKLRFCPLLHLQKWCKACVLLEGLNRGLPKLGIGRSWGSVNGSKDRNESNGGKSIESKLCGTLDF